MWIKICANTNFEDAMLAADLGVDAVGFVFAPSGRQVTVQQVAAIVPHLPQHLEKIGVFSSHDAEEIAEAVRTAGLTGVQLHGGLDVSLARKLRAGLGDRVTIIQTLHWFVDDGEDRAQLFAAQYESTAAETVIDRVLIDSKSGKELGGTGISFPWDAARATVQTIATRLIVAGGLHPKNIVDAITTLQPWGVDVASGVEASVGKKDGLKLQRFIENARLAER